MWPSQIQAGRTLTLACTLSRPAAGTSCVAIVSQSWGGIGERKLRPARRLILQTAPLSSDDFDRASLRGTRSENAIMGWEQARMQERLAAYLQPGERVLAVGFGEMGPGGALCGLLANVLERLSLVTV